MNLRMLGRLCGILLLLAGTLVLTSAVPQYTFDLDVQKTTTEWEIRWLYAASTPLIRAMLYEDGDAWTPSADWQGFLWYGTNQNWQDTSITKVTGTFSTNNAYIDFQAAVTSFPSAGVFYGGVCMTNATQTIEWGLGTVHVRESAGIGTTNVLDPSATVNWALFQFSNADEAPARPGTGLTGTTNADGSVTFVSTGVTPANLTILSNAMVAADAVVLAAAYARDVLTSNAYVAADAVVLAAAYARSTIVSNALSGYAQLAGANTFTGPTNIFSTYVRIGSNAVPNMPNLDRARLTISVPYAASGYSEQGIVLSGPRYAEKAINFHRSDVATSNTWTWIYIDDDFILQHWNGSAWATYMTWTDGDLSPAFDGTDVSNVNATNALALGGVAAANWATDSEAQGWDTVVSNGAKGYADATFITNGTPGTSTNLSTYNNDAGFLITGGTGASTNLSDYNNDTAFLVTGGTGASTNLSDYNNDAAFLVTGDTGASTNLSDYNNDAGFLTAEADNLQTVVNRGSGPVTNAPYLLQTNATDVTFAGWRMYTILGYSALKAVPDSVYIYDATEKAVLAWDTSGRYLYSTNVGSVVATFADSFRVGPDGGTNLPVYATLTNHETRIGMAVTNLIPGTNITISGTGAERTINASGAAAATTFSLAGSLATNTGALRWYAPGAVTLLDALPSVGTAPVGTNLALAVYVNGSILAGSPSIADGANVGSLTTLTNVLSDTDYLTINVTQVGTTTAGRDLSVRVRYQ